MGDFSRSMVPHCDATSQQQHFDPPGISATLSLRRRAA
jgi:hypothetical protein